MKQNQLVAGGLIISLAIGILAAVLEPYNSDNWYVLAGLGLYVFGIWASVILLKK